MVQPVEPGQEACTGHISPVHYIPSEVQIDIIKNALKSESEPGYVISFCDENPNLQTHPVLEVCKLWRQLVFDSPELWSSIEIRGNECNPYRRTFRLDDKLQALQRWLLRGRNSPLYIRFGITHRSLVSDHVPDMWKMLLAQPGRWRSLNYNGSQGQYLDVVKARSAEFVQLSRLSVSYAKRFLNENEPVVTLPNLQYLKLAGSAIAELRIEGSSVLELELIRVILLPLDISRFLQRFPNMQHLVTRDCHMKYSGHGLIVDRKLFCHLRSWEWDLGENYRTFHAEAMAQFPQLNALHLKFGNKLNFVPQIPVLPSITKLTLVDGTRMQKKSAPMWSNLHYLDPTEFTDGPGYEELLQSAPNLQELKISGHEMAYATFDYVEPLLGKEASPLLCPHLQSLTLECVELDTDSLLQLSKERMALSACRITTRHCCPTPDMHSVLYPALLVQAVQRDQKVLKSSESGRQQPMRRIRY